jgi:hypothetical protein
MTYKVYFFRRGTPLPPFPAYTHGDPGSGLLPYRKISDAIMRIPDDAPQHQEYMKPFRVPKKKLPANVFAKCITTNGGDNYHPSGHRNYTPRELAELQMFTMDYSFCGKETKIRAQIGNAVPPGVWEHYVRSIITTLEAFDAGKPIDQVSIATQSSAAAPSAAKSIHSRVQESFIRESHSLSPEPPLPSIELPFRPIDPQGAKHSRFIPSTTRPAINFGKRKLNEAFVDLTIDDKAGHAPRRSMAMDRPLVARVGTKQNTTLPAASTRRAPANFSSNGKLRGSKSSGKGRTIDLTED